MFDQLATPVVLVDSFRLSRNIESAQQRAEKASVKLRPHIKTHRSLEIARRQLAAGAVGITCAKPSEAEVFIDGGFDDIRIAYPMAGRHRLERLAALSQKATVSFCVDSLAGASQVSAVFAQAGAVARVLLKVDCGYGRAGWRWDDEALGRRAAQIAELPHVVILGVLTHAGQAYAGAGDGVRAEDVLASHARDERDRTQQAAATVSDALGRAAGELEVSIGSTPTFWHFEPSSDVPFPVSEVRPGNYVFHDLTQVDLGAATIDQNALSVLVTVVSVRERSGDSSSLHALIDAGKKTFTSDRRVTQETYGAVLDVPTREGAEAMEKLTVKEGYCLHTVSEEHGWLEAPRGSGLVVGQRLRLLVNHSCVVASTQRELYEVAGNQVVGAIEVSAGGCSR